MKYTALFYEFDLKVCSIKKLHYPMEYFERAVQATPDTFRFSRTLNDFDLSAKATFNVVRYKLIGRLRDDTLIYARENSRIKMWRCINLEAARSLLDAAKHGWDLRKVAFNQAIEKSDIWHISWVTLLERSRPVTHYGDGCKMVEFYYEGVAIK